MRRTQKLLWSAPFPGNILLSQPLPYLILMVRLFSLLHFLSPYLLPLPCLYHLSRVTLRVLALHFFIFLFVLSWIPPLFPFLIPLLTLTLSSLFTHTSMDRPSFSLSYTLTTSLPSSLPPPYPIYMSCDDAAASPSSTAECLRLIAHLRGEQASAASGEPRPPLEVTEMD